MKKNALFFLILFFFKNQVFADDKMKIGLEVYNNKAQCGVCHTLKSAKSNGEIGPNLNQIRPDITRVISAVTNGIGVMPPYEGVLSTKEIEAVAHYVSISAAE